MRGDGRLFSLSHRPSHSLRKSAACCDRFPTLLRRYLHHSDRLSRAQTGLCRHVFASLYWAVYHVYSPYNHMLLLAHIASDLLLHCSHAKASLRGSALRESAKTLIYCCCPELLLASFPHLSSVDVPTVRSLVPSIADVPCSTGLPAA